MSKVFVLYSRNKKDFLLRKQAGNNKEVIIIGGYSSTIGNAKDLLKQSTANSMIITNSYHIPRVRFVFDHYNVHGQVVSAEDILGQRDYRKSVTEPIKMILTIFFIKLKNIFY